MNTDSRSKTVIYHDYNSCNFLLPIVTMLNALNKIQNILAIFKQIE